jgi:hypothetical protein
VVYGVNIFRESVLARRVVITLENGKTDTEIDKLKEKLEKEGFRVLQVDKIEKRI